MLFNAPSVELYDEAHEIPTLSEQLTDRTPKPSWSQSSMEETAELLQVTLLRIISGSEERELVYL